MARAGSSVALDHSVRAELRELLTGLVPGADLEVCKRLIYLDARQQGLRRCASCQVANYPAVPQRPC